MDELGCDAVCAVVLAITRRIADQDRRIGELHGLVGGGAGPETPSGGLL